ncbi:unnamed protein product [Psylliodes chrysocephalus]|uniref:tRNA:m(4)X modification enzyme TRM13 n=1 Tax=Psylliodes chrysocephalus TaxID=3402493 RepID=A0A9P0CSA4_9CUCU|nr:unnamed protein product [Psylliodes chrysocephala]
MEKETKFNQPANSQNKSEKTDVQSKKQKVQIVDNCIFFVHRKKRFCKMTVKKGEQYCGEHKRISTNVGEEIGISTNEGPCRIVCPLDGKHTCYAHKLTRHLKICNARPKPAEPFIVKGFNTDTLAAQEDNLYRLLSTFSAENIAITISKVNFIYHKLIHQNLSEKYATSKLLEDEMLNPDYGAKTKKHLKQISSILGLMEEYNLMLPETCYIEFGAGKGQLSFWLSKIIDNQKSKIILIERASPKHKKDNKLAKTSNKVYRIRADISDVVLDNLEVISKHNIVGVTKHLCGEATDLAIRCLSNIHENKVSGCVLTFCCHHRCRWVPYTGKEFFFENGLDKNDFDIMCGMASWATCGTGLSRELRKGVHGTEFKQNEKDIRIGLSRQEKEEIGIWSKHILNWGRLYYLEKNKFKCYLHFYVDKDITLENVCIVAVK